MSTTVRNILLAVAVAGCAMVATTAPGEAKNISVSAAPNSAVTAEQIPQDVTWGN
ncbi:hypothetical protein [Kitasatospora sp. MAP5-34]|uniref:hypothetical protein n=1 Tax=Kitasatospora sp. MAP5-34 TaxID=3035102 RepID=UPI0024753D20|nr:hypothetical protein [Kitasatospora sp. MAP5-34]